ncbi:MAG: MFS transporter [Acutalibacteraceae bacterium]
MGLGKSTGEMSFIVSASSLFGIVLIPAVGYLNDRLKKPRLIAGLLLAAVAVLGAVFAASRSTWVLYVLNGLIMGLVSAISPVCERMAGSGRFRYGTVRVWGTIGYAAAAQLAGLVMEFIAPRMIFVLFGAAIAVAAAGFAGTDGIRFEQEAEKSTAADQLSFLSKPMFLLFAAIALVFSGMSNLNITYSPILLQELGLSTGFVGTALSLSTLVELPVILFSNRFMDRFSGRALTAAGFAVMLLQFLLYGFSSSAWLAFLSMLLLKAVGSTLFMMIMLKVVRGIVRENSVSTALGVINAANAVSTILMQNLGGFIVGALGIHTMYFLLAGLSALGLLLSLFLRVQNAKKVFS